MRTFKGTFTIPENFTGVCKIISVNEIRYYENGQLHRLDGSAILECSGPRGFHGYIDGSYYLKQQYWLHPKVIHNKLNKIMEITEELTT